MIKDRLVKRVIKLLPVSKDKQRCEHLEHQKKENLVISIKLICGVYLDNLDFLHKPTVEKALIIAKKKGYKLKAVTLGDEIIDLDGKPSDLTADNSVRVGLTQNGKRALFVAATILNSGDKLVYDREDLFHDVRAILLSDKSLLDSNQVFLDPHIFIELVERFSEYSYSMGDLDDMGLLSNNMIPRTWILDSLATGKLPYKAIKNIR